MAARRTGTKTAIQSVIIDLDGDSDTDDLAALLDAHPDLLFGGSAKVHGSAAPINFVSSTKAAGSGSSSSSAQVPVSKAASVVEVTDVDDEPPPTCPICFCDVDNDADRVAPCTSRSNHQYHATCFCSWLRSMLQSGSVAQLKCGYTVEGGKMCDSDFALFRVASKLVQPSNSFDTDLGAMSATDGGWEVGPETYALLGKNDGNDVIVISDETHGAYGGAGSTSSSSSTTPASGKGSKRSAAVIDLLDDDDDDGLVIAVQPGAGAAGPSSSSSSHSSLSSNRRALPPRSNVGNGTYSASSSAASAAGAGAAPRASSLLSHSPPPPPAEASVAASGPAVASYPARSLIAKAGSAAAAAVSSSATAVAHAVGAATSSAVESIFDRVIAPIVSAAGGDGAAYGVRAAKRKRRGTETVSGTRKKRKGGKSGKKPDDDDDDDMLLPDADGPGAGASSSAASAAAGAASSDATPPSKDGELLTRAEFNRINAFLSRKAAEKTFKARFTDCPGSCGNSLMLEGQDVGSKGMRCPVCNTQVCTKCGGKDAQGHTCATIHLSEKEKKLLKKINMKICPSCQNGVQKNTGCNHSEYQSA